MKLAILGADADTRVLAAAALAAGHQIIWAAETGGAAELGPSTPADCWEDLFDPDLADGIVIGRGDADTQLRGRQVQELVKQGRPLLASFPLFDSVLTFFEVDMARSESGAVIRHFNPVLASAPLDMLRAALDYPADELGAVEQIQCERPLEDRSRAKVQRHFARDAELLDAIVGGLDRVGAHGAAVREAPTPQAYAGLSVQLSGRRDLPVRWTVLPPHAAPAMQLAIVGERGRLTIEYDGAGNAVRATRQSATGEHDRQLNPAPAAAIAIGEFAEAVSGRREQLPAGDGELGSTWPSALHAMELADSIEISLRRGRMIDVHGQQLTEQLAFRGTMAAAGCGLLLVLPPLLLLAGWIAGLLGVKLADYWPHVLLGLLALFLALQVLPKLIYPAPGAKQEPGEGGPRP